MGPKLISICIPTYKRPLELKRMLESIDTTKIDDVEIVISENCSPKQRETREVVEEYKNTHKYEIHYYENERNLGYDKNIRALVQRASGRFCMFFSDDDMFMPNAMDEFVEFVRDHEQCGYILRSYRNYSLDGSYQDFRYYSSDRLFPAGKDSAVDLFNKSVFLSGFTIRTEYAKEYLTDVFDGSLLYQMYLLLEVCRRHPSAYSRILISKSVPFPTGSHYFGECDEEKSFYSSGMAGNSRLNFHLWYFKIIDYIEEKYRDGTGTAIRKNMSKLSYPMLAKQLQENPNKKDFRDYCKALKKEGLGTSIYFYLYSIVLQLFGVRNCNKTIAFIKKIIGHRPNL